MHYADSSHQKQGMQHFPIEDATTSFDHKKTAQSRSAMAKDEEKRRVSGGLQNLEAAPHGTDAPDAEMGDGITLCAEGWHGRNIG
jgi:hypothetical protein